MKKVTLLTLAAITLLYISCGRVQKTLGTPPVNPLLGDISFIEKFGHAPTETDDDLLRIQTHLEYVENKLRATDTKHLNEVQRKNRASLLHSLHNYWVAGIFPKNHDYKNQRRPCFIDKEGNICAVGYLIEVSAGRDAAEAINEKYKYEYIANMKGEMLENWMAENGLSREECAMIQPTYNFGPTTPIQPEPISENYAVLSACLMGLNTSMGIVNTMQINKGSRNNIASYLGIAGGTSAVLMGIMRYNDDMKDFGNGPVSTTHGRQQTLSMFNIGIGTSTLFISIWNLATSNKSETTARRTSYNFYPVSVHNNSGLGFSFTRRF